MAAVSKAFIVGPGFIGWNVLDLLVSEGYSVSALVRRKEAADDITKSGGTPITGGLDDKAIITQQTAQSDVVIHTASADHLPSVEAIIDGLKERAAKGLSTIYIHNSGAAIFDDGAAGEHTTTTIYKDDDQKIIDAALPDTAPHRNVDLVILKAKKELGDHAKIAIFIPPLIYGVNPKHARLSIQVPILTRFAIKEGFAGHVGKGASQMSTIHVLDLARAYMVALHHLEKTAPSDPDVANPYYFIEADGDNEPSFYDMAAAIGDALNKKGRLKDPEPKTIPESKYDQIMGPYTSFVFGCNSRTRSVRLRKLGWKPTEKSWKQAYLDEELPLILQEK